MKASGATLRHLNFEVFPSWKEKEAYGSLLGFRTGSRGNKVLLHKMTLKEMQQTKDDDL